MNGINIYMRALPFQAPAPHVYIRMRQANIEKRLSKSWPKKNSRWVGLTGRHLLEFK